MTGRPRRARAGAIVATAAVTLLAGHAAAARADDSQPHRGVRELFVPAVQADFHRLAPGWRGVGYVAVTGAAVWVVAANDAELYDRINANDSETLDDLARVAEPLGYEALVAAGVVAWGVAWHAAGDPMFATVQRIDLSVASAGVGVFVLKQIVGRERPEESPGDPYRFDPFSGHDSFPSGHTALAFAAAASLDRETGSRWVPALAYPIAGLVGWSRVHDHKHWPSDVVAGAAIGFGIAWKAEDVMLPGGGSSARLELGTGDGALAAIRLRW